MAPLTRSRQDYLKALWALAPGGEPVAPSRLAAALSVSAPSVTHMLARLSAEGLVAHSRGAGARLTARGRREALGMVRRHRILESFLVEVLGLDWSEVHEDAEVLEHHVSDRVLEALDRVMGHPAEDPHGSPIPDAHGRVAQRALVPLAGLPRGARARVRRVRETDARRLARWKALGLVPGARVRVSEVRGPEGVIELVIGGRRVVTARAALEGVWAEPVRGGAHGG
jgi:DtxR family Mn-dependent transcriptional regulator